MFQPTVLIAIALFLLSQNSIGCSSSLQYNPLVSIIKLDLDQLVFSLHSMVNLLLPLLFVELLKVMMFDQS
jgi:hypothetical protein